jgi:DeoR/GlpR family transcriptional regulator of sugar metabolism
MQGTRDRRAQIVELVSRSEHVDVSVLAQRFGVSDTSIRRDLAILESQNRLRRVHGGAVAPYSADRETIVGIKMREHQDEKRRIARTAVGLIGQGNVVLLDSGTTVAQVPAQLPAHLRMPGALTAVTHSLLVVQQMASREGGDLICLGGLFLPDYQAFVGPQTVAGLKGFFADVVFLGCDGLSPEAGITTPHVLIAEVGATMAARARRVVALADSSKLGRSGFTTILPLAEVDILITDSGAAPDAVERVQSTGVEVILA